jgi:small-conductance mechanosensitive channel
MENDALLSNLLADLFDDLHTTQVLWEFALVFACLGLGWFLSRVLTRVFAATDPESDLHRMRAKRFSHVLTPLLMLVLIIMVRPIFAKWHHTHLMNLIVPLLGSLVLIRFGFYVLRRTFLTEGSIRNYLGVIEKVFAAMVWLGLILHYTGTWQDLLTALNDIELPIGRNKITLLSIIQATISILVTLVIAMWASTALEARLMKLPTMHSSLKVVLSRTGRATFILIAILFSLSLVGIDLTVLSVFGGALGVGLGFGLQKITSSYVSGFIILLDRSLSIGDMIAVDKYNGKVTQINTRYTVLKGPDGAEAVIPNEMLVSNAVQNYSLTDKSVFISTDMTVSYDTDIEKLLADMAKAAVTVPRVLSDPAPAGYLVKFGMDGLDLRLGFWINDPENGRGSVLSAVNRELWKLFQEQKIELPYAHRTITVLNAADKVSGADENSVQLRDNSKNNLPQ